jgi:hypothetical protein
MQEPDVTNRLEPVNDSRKQSSAGRRASIDRRQSSAKALRVKPLPEASIQISQNLQARLVTTSSKSEAPHLDASLKRKHIGKLAPLQSIVSDFN